MKVEKRKEYGLRQLNIEVPEWLLENIKAAAKKRNIPMRTWTLRAIYDWLKKEL